MKLTRHGKYRNKGIDHLYDGELNFGKLLPIKLPGTRPSLSLTVFFLERTETTVTTTRCY